MLTAFRRGDDAVGVVFVTIQNEDGIEGWSLHESEGIGEAIGFRYPIPVADCSQQAGRDVTDGPYLKSVAEGLQDREMDDLRDFAKPDNPDVDLRHWSSPHGPYRFEPARSIPLPA
jgi:hypothetical protein